MTSRKTSDRCVFPSEMMSERGNLWHVPQFPRNTIRPLSTVYLSCTAAPRISHTLIDTHNGQQYSILQDIGHQQGCHRGRYQKGEYWKLDRRVSARVGPLLRAPRIKRCATQKRARCPHRNLRSACIQVRTASCVPEFTIPLSYFRHPCFLAHADNRRHIAKSLSDTTQTRTPVISAPQLKSGLRRLARRMRCYPTL